MGDFVTIMNILYNIKIPEIKLEIPHPTSRHNLLSRFFSKCLTSAYLNNHSNGFLIVSRFFFS